MASAASSQPTGTTTAEEAATSTTSTSAKSTKDKVPFPVGPAGKRELRNELKATTNPARTIQEFQDSHSLHTMMAKAFGTIPTNNYKNTRKSTGEAETLDSDSVLKFLSHLGVSQYEVHKRVSDSLLQQICDDIRKTDQEEPLFDLLKSCWAYSTTIPELRPVLWAVLKQLGPKTPLAVLTALTERIPSSEKDAMVADNSARKNVPLRHAEIFKPLPLSLKRLCWEADWDNRLLQPLEGSTTTDVYDPTQFLEHVRTTVLFETIAPHMNEYLNNPLLCEAANRTFCLTIAERRILTTQRRALTKRNAAPTPTVASATAPVLLTSGKAVSQLRNLLCDTSYRPKLLFAVLSVLMAQHGCTEKDFLGGSQHLHCTLVADVLLSAGGPLPQSYSDLLTLTRTLDDVVQEANLTDANLSKIQASLKLIFQPDQPEAPGGEKTAACSVGNSNPLFSTTKSRAPEMDIPTTAVRRQLNRLITAGLTSMKESDPQQLFLNPVTDAIAPGYSNIIKIPMSMVTMEEKVATNVYNSVSEWEIDVKLMFKNCVDYNRGAAGQWFRSEANRQAKIFREEIYSKANRLYQSEIAKRNVMITASDDAPSPMDGLSTKRVKRGLEIHPLEPSSKKRKKEKEEFLPSMPALAAMLLSDPFVVRILLARVLRELRRGVVLGQSLPCAHAVVPSILQILHLARWSKQICAMQGKKYFIPAAGFTEMAVGNNTEDPMTKMTFASLRRYLPMMLRLLLEAELDRRIGVGGDLHLATQSTVSLKSPPHFNKWDGSDQDLVMVALVQDSLLHICQPGVRNEVSLAVTFPKFASALREVSTALLNDRAFFVALSQALLRYKAKLPRTTRDAVVAAWISWLETEKSMSSVAHECLIGLLNDWSCLGNVLLPRETMLRFCDDVIQGVAAANTSAQFADEWKSSAHDFAPIKKQYNRMLTSLPEASARQWKQKHGLETSPGDTEAMDVEEDDNAE